MRNKELRGGLNKKIPSLEKDIAKNKGTNMGKSIRNKNSQGNIGGIY